MKGVGDMASISSVSSSSSIYGSRNVISGLASGLDTEGMIENAISAYKNKITSLSQKRTKTEWKQESYRSMIEKMSSFLTKYTSYRSSNNLMSTSFFDQAVKTVAKGSNADKVTATGRSSSDIRVDRVRQLASAATYKLSGTFLDKQTSDFNSGTVSAAAPGSMDLDKDMTISTFSGSMTLAYGGSNALSYLTINFDETKTYDNAQELADEINRQLEEQTVTIGSKSYTGKELTEELVRAEVKDGKITFADPKNNNVYISAASDSVKKQLLGGQDLSSIYGKQVKSLDASGVANMKETMSTLEYLSSKGGSLQITLDGVTKTVKMPTAKDIKADKDDKRTPAERDQAYLEALQKNIDEAFGKGKLTVSDKNGGEKGIQLQFTTGQKGSTFSVQSDKGETLGFGESNQITSYLNTSKTLGELLGEDGFKDLEALYELKVDSNGKVTKVPVTDTDGNQLYSFKVNGKEVGRFNENTTLSTVINTMNSNSDSGVKVGYSKLTNELTFTAKDTGAASEIQFEGLSSKLFGSPGTYDDKGDGTYTKGQDAILEVSINGTSLGEITRSSNSVELDGMTINLKGTFGYETDEDGNIKYDVSQSLDEKGNPLFSVDQGDGKSKQFSAEKLDDGRLAFLDEKSGKTVYGSMDEDGKLTFENQKGEEVYARVDAQGRLRFDAGSDQAMDVSAVTEKTAVPDDKAEAVTFETSSDADKIVDVVKEMVADYNAMVTEIKNAYSTLPLYRNQSKNQLYEPLTDEDKEGMSESTIEAWEEKAKTGILFGDNDLRSLYTRLTSAVSMTGENGAALRAAGITVNYSNGLSTLEFNETKFRDALNNDPDAVRDAFTASMESGAKSNGLMQALKQPLELYGKTEGGKGVLVSKAGSPLAPSTMYTNTIQQELDKIDKEIEKWEDKMSDQVDYYTSKFSQLEQLVAQMNSQSSYFAQLMGG